jgi:hypothetical protein
VTKRVHRIPSLRTKLDSSILSRNDHYPTPLPQTRSTLESLRIGLKSFHKLIKGIAAPCCPRTTSKPTIAAPEGDFVALC